MILDCEIIQCVKENSLKKYKVRGFKPSKMFLIMLLVREYNYSLQEAKQEILVKNILNFSYCCTPI